MRKLLWPEERLKVRLWKPFAECCFPGELIKDQAFGHRRKGTDFSSCGCKEDYSAVYEWPS